MRILLLCQKLPLPLEDGYNLRIQAYVRRLAARHEIHLVSLDQGSMPADMQACFKSIRTAGIRKVPRATTLVQRVFQAFSADHLHDFDPDVMRVVEEAAASAEFDLIWVSGWKMLPYSRRLKNAPPVFGDVIDEGAQEAVVELRKTRSPRDFLYRYKELCAIRGFERQYFAHLKVATLVSDADGDAVKKTCGPRLDVRVVHNGVDPEFFAPQDVEPDHPSLIFEGSMSHPPNVEGIVLFCQRVLPLIHDVLPNTRLWIVGRDPVAEVRALAEPKIEVTGFVDDVRPYLAKATVFICPLVGGAGIKNKILQAWSMMKPVVATTISSGGLESSGGENLIVADEPRDLANACLELLGDEERRQELGSNGRTTVLAHYSWDAKTRELETLLEEVAGTSSKGA